MPEWTKIGSGPVEYCIGTDGVVGISGGIYVQARGKDGLPISLLIDDGVLSAKAKFEARHCQPPAPRHVIREYADGSCVVESTEQDEQGRPLRCAIVREGIPVTWVANWKCDWAEFRTKKAAFARAVRYVETGE